MAAPGRLNSNLFVNSSNPNTGVSGSFTPNAGVNYVTVIAFYQGASATAASATYSATYGGVAMTEINRNANQVDQDRATVLIFGIRTTSTAAVTVEITCSENCASTALFVQALSNVPGSTDLDAVSAVGNDGTSTPSVSSTFNVANVDDNTITIGGIGVQGGDAGPFTPGSGWTEIVDSETGADTVNDLSLFVQSRTQGAAATLSFNATWNLSDGFGAVAASFIGTAGDTVDLSATMTAVSGSSASTTVIQSLAATMAAASGSASRLNQMIDLAGTTAIVSGTVPPRLVKEIDLAGTIASLSSSDANELIKKQVSGTMAAVSGGTADATPFVGFRATGAAASGGRANADPPVPAVLPPTLAETFITRQAPVLLIDLFFDSAELNIWTRPFPRVFEGKEYVPLAGVTEGFSFRNSLDLAGLDSSLQVSGQSQEILSYALTEEFQNRLARVRLANLDEDGEISAVETIHVGFMTNMPITDDNERSTVSIVIESVFKSVNSPETFRLSSADQALIDADDSFFDFFETAKVTSPAFGSTT